MKAERAMLLAAKARGVARFHAFSLSGTPRMTRNGFVNADAGRHTTNLRRDAEADYATYIDAFCGDDAIGTHLGKTLGYHSYWSDGGDVFWKHRAALRRKLDAFPGWRVFQTEYCVMQRGRDLGMNTALHLARVLHGDLSIVNVSGWSWWLAFSPHDYKDGLLFTDWKYDGDEESILVSKTFWVLGQHSRFVRPGMTRVAISGPGLQDHAGLLATAYHDAGSHRVVIVYVYSGRSDARIRLRVTGHPTLPKNQSAHITSAAPADDLRALARTEAGTTVTIAARAVVTVVLH